MQKKLKFLKGSEVFDLGFAELSENENYLKLNVLFGNMCFQAAITKESIILNYYSAPDNDLAYSECKIILKKDSQRSSVGKKIKKTGIGYKPDMIKIVPEINE